MEDKSGGDGGAGIGGGGEPSRVVAPKVMKAGDRQVFTVELRQGETTYVSWKKLVKDANRANRSSASAAAAATVVAAPAPEPPPTAHPNLQSRIAPVRAASSIFT